MPIIGTIASSFRSAAGGVTYTLINSTTLTSSSVSVLFNNIPSTYNHLELRMSLRVLTTPAPGLEDDLYIDFNNTSTSWSGANIGTRIMYWAGGMSDPSYIQNYDNFGPAVPNNGVTSNAFGNVRLLVQNYKENQLKVYVHEAGFVDFNNVNGGAQSIGGGLWNNTAPITSVNVFGPNGALTTSSTISLYGIRTA